jgi:hypothetical protein
LCGSPSYPIFNEFRDFYNNGSYGIFWNFEMYYQYLYLGSLSHYLTVNFYYKQGMLQSLDDAQQSFTQFKHFVLNDVLDPVDYAKQNIRFFKSGKCPYELSEKEKKLPKEEQELIDKQYLDNIFQACDCGGNKYLFPELVVKLGNTSIEFEDTNMISVDFLKLFGDYLQSIIDDPESIKNDIKDYTKYKILRNIGVNKNIESGQVERKSFLNRQVKRTIKKQQENETIKNVPSKYKEKPGIQVRTNTGSGVKGTKFYEQLKSYNITPEAYLKEMKRKAKKAGYDEKQLMLDNDDKHKLRISTEQGIKHFGAVGYKDFYIYKQLEKQKKIPKGEANKFRDRFVKSHGALSKKKKLGRNSPNELALKILW